MPAEPGNALEREQRLDEVIAAYTEAVEAGLQPDRREWLARYPDLAADLEAFFADEDQFASLVAPLRVSTPAPGALTQVSPPRPAAATPVPLVGPKTTSP